jgi:hypothetical protein
MACDEAKAPAEVANVIPSPPFTNDDPWAGSGEGVVKCFFPGCDKTFGTHLKLIEHIRSKGKHGHGTPYSAFKGTPFHAKFTAEHNVKQKARYHTVDADEDEAPSATTAAAPCDGGAQPTKKAKTDKQIVMPRDVGDVGGTCHEERGEQAQQFKWVARLCWLKANMDGSLVFPLQVRDTVEHKGASSSTDIHAPSADHAALHHPTGNVRCSPPRFHDTRVHQQPRLEQSVALVSKSDARACATEVVTASCITADREHGFSDERHYHPLVKVLAKMADNVAETKVWVDEQKDKTKWQRGLPLVDVKPKYLSIQPPAAKGDDDVERADFPRDLKPDQVEVQDFTEYMMNYKLKKGSHLHKILLGARRILGFLDVTPDQAKPNVDINSCETIVSLCLAKKHTKLLDSPLLGRQYGWSASCVAGLHAYIGYLKYVLEGRLMSNEDDAWQQYMDVLNRFVGDIENSWTKRCKEYAAQMHLNKQAADLAIIKQIRIPTLQRAVYKGYATLLNIQSHFGTDSLPKNVRGLANAALAGGIAFDTFSGRKYEWEILKHAYVHDAICNGGDHLVCSQHKTAKTYGSIAKFLSPGLATAFAVYDSFARPDGFARFIVPASYGTTKVSLPGALNTFCRNFLDDDHVVPTFNIMRKMFHTHLHKIHGNDDRLKELMVILDAHSKAVQGRHYVLRDPEDDVKLARQLVFVVLGSTVEFPTMVDARQLRDDDAAVKHAFEKMFRAPSSVDERCDSDDDEPDDDESDEVLEFFEGAAMWGILKPPEQNFLALLDIEGARVDNPPEPQRPLQLEDRPPHDEPMPILDAQMLQAQSSAEVTQHRSDVAVKVECAAQPPQVAVPFDPLAFNPDTAYDFAAPNYRYVLDGCGTRSAIRGATHAKIRQVVREWQRVNGRDAYALPVDGRWYKNLRCFFIDHADLTADHGWHACRNSARAYVAQLKNADPANALVAQLARSTDVS